MAINPSPVVNQMQALTNTDKAKVTATTTPAPSFLQAPTTQAPATITAPAGLSTAQQILQTEGISSSKQLLDSMKVPSARDILAGSGITSAQDILEKEGLKIQRQKLLQDEMELRQEELDYMKNYKFDANTFNPTAYETKYGDLDFKDATIQNGWGWLEDELYTAYRYKINGENYYFMPESVATKGVKNPTTNAQMVNWGFLNKDTWSALAEYGQAMDLSSMDASLLKRGEGLTDGVVDPRWTPTDEQLKGAQSRGFLFSEEDWKTFNSTHLNKTWVVWGPKHPDYGLGKNKYGGDVQGISQLPSGELVYITQPSGGYDQVSTYINSQGVPWHHWYNAAKRKTVVQKFVGGVGDVLNAVPFLPEIIALTVPGGAQFYPAMKGSQAVASGGDLGDVLTTMGTAYIATSPVMKNATASLTETFTSTLGATGAKIAAGAVVNAGFAGTVAALTGQDVGKAVTTGALTGGFAAGTPAIAEVMFKGTDVTQLANAVGLNKAQFQNIVVSSLGNSAIQAAVYNRDFGEMFTQSLVVSGLSTAAANKVYDSFKGNLNDKELQKAIRGTQLVVQATARAAIRGTDVEKELERAMMSFAKGEIAGVQKDITKAVVEKGVEEFKNPFR